MTSSEAIVSMPVFLKIKLILRKIALVNAEHQSQDRRLERPGALNLCINMGGRGSAGVFFWGFLWVCFLCREQLLSPL